MPHPHSYELLFWWNFFYICLFIHSICCISVIIILQMFMPAGNDDPNVKMGGLGKKVLGDGLEILEFPDMVHGWTVRGDLVNIIS